MELGVLKEALHGTSAGPKPAFTMVHLLEAIFVVQKEGPIGRKIPSDRLSLGAGVVRTLIWRLRSHHILSEDKQGCKLTEKGLRLYSMLQRRISQPVVTDAGRLFLNKWNAIILVRGGASRIHLGLEQRDAAVRVGATGANTIIYSDGRFLIPGGSSDCAGDFPDSVWERLRVILKPEDGDLIIVSGAPSSHVAEQGVLAAAWTIISD
jgi:hypothetical protein